MLVGLPGSGKSYFANKLNGWTVISQDNIGSRNECENEFSSVVKKEKKVILDRCNVDKNDRKYWLSLAMNHPNACAVFLIILRMCVPRELLIELIIQQLSLAEEKGLLKVLPKCLNHQQ